MKICDECGHTHFTFVAEDHYVKYTRPVMPLWAKILLSVISYLASLLFVSSTATEEQLVPVSLFLLFIYIIFFILIIIIKPMPKYKEKRKTVAICEGCWKKFLVEDEEEEKQIEVNKLFYSQNSKTTKVPQIPTGIQTYKTNKGPIIQDSKYPMKKEIDN